MGYTLGIDFGTGFSKVALTKDSKTSVLTNSYGKTSTPSAIYFDEYNLVAGEEAVELWKLCYENLARNFKRDTETRNFSLKFFSIKYYIDDMVTSLFKKLKGDAEINVGQRIDSCVIAIPTYFNTRQREIILKSADGAGFLNVETIYEPVAIATAYGLNDIAGVKRVLVYDLGAGRFDVSLLEIKDKKINIIGSASDENISGMEFDTRLLSFIADKFMDEFNLDILKYDEDYHKLLIRCEALKRELATRDNVSIKISYCGFNGKYIITKDEFLDINLDLIEKSMDLSLDLIEDNEMHVNDIDCILLTGGLSNMDVIKEAVVSSFKKIPLNGVKSDEAVAIGSAIYGDSLSKRDEKKLAIDKNILIAIDLSGSMCGQPMDESERAAKRFVKNSNLENTSIGIVAFADKLKTVMDFTSVSEDLISSIDNLHKIDVGVGTSNHPLDYAIRSFRRVSGLKYLVILTDGQWYGSNSRNALELANECRELGIEIIALGFGDAREDFLKSIASCDENGLYTSMDNIDGCFKIIAKEISKAKKGSKIKVFENIKMNN